MLPDVNLCLSPNTRALHEQQVINYGLGGVNATSDVKNSISADFSALFSPAPGQRAIHSPALYERFAYKKRHEKQKDPVAHRTFQPCLAVWKVRDST